MQFPPVTSPLCAKAPEFLLLLVHQVTSGAAFTVAKLQADKCPSASDLQCYLIVGLVASILLMIGSAFAVFTAVKKLRDAFGGLNRFIFIAVSISSYICLASLISFSISFSSFYSNAQAGILIAAGGCVVGYAAVYVFTRPCISSAAGLLSAASGDSIFQAKDAHMIAVFLLNLLTFGILLSAGAILTRRGIK